MTKNIEIVEDRLVNLVENSKLGPIQSKYKELAEEFQIVKKELQNHENFLTNLKVLGKIKFLKNFLKREL